MTKKTTDTPAEDAGLDLFDILGRDPEAEEKGAWFPLEYEGVAYPEIQFLIRSFASKAGKKYFTLSAKLQKTADKEESSLVQGTVKALLDSGILADWKGIRVAGKEVPFTEAQEVLSNPKFDQAVVFIIEKARQVAAFREAGKAQATKN